MLHHIFKEQSVLLQAVTELKGMWHTSRKSAEGVSPPSVPPPLPPLSVATACPLPPSPPPALRENTLPVPEKFSGELDKCGNFLTQRALILRQQVQAYATDSAKITLMVQKMTGRALK